MKLRKYVQAYLSGFAIAIPLVVVSFASTEALANAIRGTTCRTISTTPGESANCTVDGLVVTIN